MRNFSSSKPVKPASMPKCQRRQLQLAQQNAQQQEALSERLAAQRAQQPAAAQTQQPMVFQDQCISVTADQDFTTFKTHELMFSAVGDSDLPPIFRWNLGPRR